MRLAYQQADKLSQIVVDDAVSEDWSSGTPVSLTTEISKIKQAGADCVELWLTPQDEAAFATSAAHLGDHFTILGSDNMTSTNIFQQLAGKYANGALAPQLTSVVKNSPAIVAFDKAFRAKYHVEASVNAYGAYMGMFILARAIETAKGSTSPTAIQASLNKLKNFSGLMGTISYSPKLHTAIQPGQLTLERWNAGPKTWTSVFTGGSQ
jgi:ABC-type branched-subunit amino acid transport system substrate-binding protein